MYQLVRLGNCIHVYDTQNAVFVKSTLSNIRKALDPKGLPTTRKAILRGVQWTLCSDPGCRVQSCRKDGHWIARHAAQ